MKHCVEQRGARTRSVALWSGVWALSLLLAACSPAPHQEPVVRAVRTLVLSEAGGVLDREFSGEVKARVESRLGFRVPGKLTQRSAELGQSVRAGQMLAQVDPTDLRLVQEAARAALVGAQAQANQAQADFKRMQDLKAQGFISPAQLEHYQTAVKANDAALAQARAQVAMQGNQAAYSTLTADASGVITSVDAEPGQVVAAGQPIVTLAHDGPRDVVFAVPEDMGPTVRPLVGKAGALKVRRWGTDKWVSATIREMAASADAVTRTLLVKADVVGMDASLGQTATVALTVPSRAPQGLHLPLNALVEHEGQSAVWVLDPQAMTVALQPVVTAEISGNVILVARGLKLGQEVITAGVHVLTPGQKVRRLLAPGATPTAATPAASVTTH
jgi:multidrug efflux system membrane fusion protein